MSSLRFVVDHLWQSTLVVGAIAALAPLLRGRHAGVRYGLWLAASMKFAVPFAALGAVGAFVGSRLAWSVPPPAPPFLDEVSRSPFGLGLAQPAAGAVATTTASWSIAEIVPAVVVAIWAAGFVAAFAVWSIRWSRAALALRRAAPLTTGREVDILRRLERTIGHARPLPIRATTSAMEPGVFGIVRHTLLWPLSMSDHLADDQIETILIHELSHVRRRDNLTALAHSLVQCLFWFHPVVWWIGTRLIEERERACDDDVVRMGHDRRVYAESLLKTCQFCIGAPVTSMAGVTGSDLKRRVAHIMAGSTGTRLGAAGRVALIATAVTVLAAPILGGAAAVPQVSGVTLPDPSRSFEAASVRENKGGSLGSGFKSDAGHFAGTNMTLRSLLVSAFAVRDAQIVGGPGWLTTDRFDIVAKAGTSTSDADLKIMLQNLLIERFAIKTHVDTRNLPIYALTRARADGQLGPSLQKAECATYSSGQGCGSSAGPGMEFSGGGGAQIGPARGGGIEVRAGVAAGGPNMMSKGTTMDNFAKSLSRSAVDRIVVDRTGLEGRFDLALRYSRPSMNGGGSGSDAPDIFTALKEQLGLKLEAMRGPVDVLVIDSAEHPVNDDFVVPESR
jgi:uncharacterized protein (TIGR03435 family)